MRTVDAKEIENFAKDSLRWWDEDGPFAPLHRVNPVRLSYIRDQICGRHGRDDRSFTPFRGLSVLDIGCGGGLVCEKMARLGAAVTGIDADANAITVAKAHAQGAGLAIDYKNCSSEELLGRTPHPNLPPSNGGKAFTAVGTSPAVKSSPRLRGEDLGGGPFDVVLALEIVEHVADVDLFVQDCADLCKPGGLIVFSTLNRTAKSFILGKVAAEYILGWVAPGTHDWKKFLKPSELSRSLRRAGADILDIEGMVFDPLTNGFRRARSDVGVNYFLTAGKN